LPRGPHAIVTIIAKNRIIAKNKGARNIPGALEAPSRHDWQKQSGEGARFAEWNARIAQGAGRYGLSPPYQTAASTAVTKAKAAQIERISTLMVVDMIGSPSRFGSTHVGSVY
jgi:hypothetical protein